MESSKENMTVLPLHIETPLVESLPLSERVDGRVWLKMEALQPSGSFKLRGIGHACREYIARGAKGLISSSGGNAGIAVAYSGRKLGVRVTVVVPETTSQRAIDIIEQEEAEVIVNGATWQEAHTHSLSLTDNANVYIHPFDDSLIWTGHASLIDEVKRAGLKPDAVVLSVGGGGLLSGVIEGLLRNGMEDVPVIAMETEGADSLSQSLKAGQHMALEDITSIATSLGAKKIAGSAWDWCHRHPVISRVVSDRDAISACVNFSSDHRLLVEPACGASLAAVYSPGAWAADRKNILIIVCGGAGITISQLEAWKHYVGL